MAITLTKNGKRWGRKPTIKGGVVVSFWLPEETAKKLDRLAAEEIGCRSRSDYLRKLLTMIE